MPLLIFLFLFFAFLQMPARGEGAPRAENLVAGRTYTVNLAPNYRRTTGPKDPGKDPDRDQLTDGVFSQERGKRYPGGHFWNTPTSVAWKTARSKGVDAVEITFDLETPKAIRSVSFQTAAGYVGWERFEWPLAALLFVSDDGKRFRFVEDLLFVASWDTSPPTGAYQVHRFHAKGLNAAGRYVRLVFVPTPSTTTATPVVLDEIEIFGGPVESVSPAAPSPSFFGEDQTWRSRPVLTWLGLRKRLQRDWVKLRALGVPENKLAPLKREIIALRAVDVTIDEPGALASTPTGEALLRLRGERLAAEHGTQLLVSEVDRWAPLDPLAPPPAPSSEPLAWAGVAGERRSRALLVTNPGGERRRVTFHLDTPGGVRIGLRQVDFLDTPFFERPPFRLRTLAGRGNRLTLKAGESKVIWIDADFLPEAGGSEAETSSMLTITARGEKPVRIPLVFHRFGWKPSRGVLHTGGFDYIDQVPIYAVHAGNRDAFVQRLEEGGIDTVFGTRMTLPLGEYDAEGRRIADPDPTRLRQWLALWKPGKRFFIYVHASRHFEQIPRERLPGVLKEWSRFWEQAFRKEGVAPASVILHFTDEARTEAALEEILLISRTLKESGSPFTLWTNPNVDFLRPEYAAFYAYVDIIAPHRPLLINRNRSAREFLAELGRGGKMIELYSCMGPMHRLSPLHYVRLQAWDTFSLNGAGHYLWSFADGGPGGATNGYINYRYVSNTPLALSGDRVESTPHFEAMREGTWDVRYLERFLQLRKAAPDQPEGRELEERLRAWMEKEVFFDRAFENMAWTPREQASREADALIFAIGSWIEKNLPAASTR